MKKIKILLVAFLAMFFLAACGSSEPDYTTEQAEAALNDGENIEGKTVEITVDEFIPDGTLGYTIWTGEHLNFISSENPEVKEGDTIVVKVTKVKSALGSYIINYEKQ